MYYDGKAIICVTDISEGIATVSVQLVDANGQQLGETWTGTLSPGTCLCVAPVGIEGEVSTGVDYCEKAESNRLIGTKSAPSKPAPAPSSGTPPHKK